MMPMVRTLVRRLRGDARGQGLLEFSLVLPLFLINLKGYSGALEEFDSHRDAAVPYTAATSPEGAVPWGGNDRWIPGTWPAPGQTRTLPGEPSNDPFEVGWGELEGWGAGRYG